MTVFLQLFFTFFIIGAFTIGGGYAMLSLIQAEVVTQHHWLSESAFTDIVAVSQMTPGPVGINTATYVGYEVIYAQSGSHFLGILGSLSTTLALVLPSFLIMLLVVHFYTRMKGNPIYEGVMAGLRPTVVGLIGAAAVLLTLRFGPGLDVSLVKENFPDWSSWVFFGLAFVASYWGKFSPILLIVLSAAAGLILY
ncbi:MAG: chromate transporter [Bacteroidales bacterium]|nr:chromate transporter [Bacteroidales bacterium]